MGAASFLLCSISSFHLHWKTPLRKETAEEKQSPGYKRSHSINDRNVSLIYINTCVGACWCYSLMFASHGLTGPLNNLSLSLSPHLDNCLWRIAHGLQEPHRPGQPSQGSKSIHVVSEVSLCPIRSSFPASSPILRQSSSFPCCADPVPVYIQKPAKFKALWQAGSTCRGSRGRCLSRSVLSRISVVKLGIQKVPSLLVSLSTSNLLWFIFAFYIPPSLYGPQDSVLTLSVLSSQPPCELCGWTEDSNRGSKGQKKKVAVWGFKLWG